MRTAGLPLYLTRSKLRTDLLALFFLNPEVSYYLRELSRSLNCSVGGLARELKTFTAEGLLERDARGHQIYYRINRGHPLFHEIKGIIEKTAGVPQKLREGLRGKREIQEAYLYGSAVSGKMTAESDIDLLLVGKETPCVRKWLKQLESKYLRSLNAVCYSPEEFLKKRGDKAEFLYEVMRSPRIQLKP